MMIPTNYLRQRKSYAMICDVMVLVDVITQQWWCKKMFANYQPCASDEQDGSGEWRDVPTVEGE